MGKWVSILGRVPMGEREDYADLNCRPWRIPRSFVKWTLRIGIVSLLVGIGVMIYYASTPISERGWSVGWSMNRAEALAFACREYYRQNPDKKYPATLADLKKPPPWFDWPAIQDYEFTDAWENPFRYALVPNADGELEPHVWTEMTRDGRTTLLGVKLTADGVPVRFGLTER